MQRSPSLSDRGALRLEGVGRRGDAEIELDDERHAALPCGLVTQFRQVALRAATPTALARCNGSGEHNQHGKRESHAAHESKGEMGTRLLESSRGSPCDGN